MFYSDIQVWDKLFPEKGQKKTPPPQRKGSPIREGPLHKTLYTISAESLYRSKIGK